MTLGERSVLIRNLNGIRKSLEKGETVLKEDVLKLVEVTMAILVEVTGR